MSPICQRVTRAFDAWLFDGPNLALVPWFRMAMGCLICVNAMVWYTGADRWFGDEGYTQSQTIQTFYADSISSLYFWIPANEITLRIGLICIISQSLLMVLGVWSRFQAVCLFLWLLSFQHRNPLICDGEDTLFRLFTLIMVFLPLDYRYSLLNRFRQPPTNQERPSAWAFRLIQAIIVLLYVSTVFCKWEGETWRNGTALYYVTLMHDHFGRWHLPYELYTNHRIVAAMTWGVLILELALPLTLWITRVSKWAIFAGILFHLGIESSMHLFLFQWLMIVGLLTFYPSVERIVPIRVLRL